MGSPGYTVFCKEGHIVKQVPHHYIDESKREECQYCGSKLFFTELEWGDPEYGPFFINSLDCREEWIDVDNHCVRGKIKVLAYNTDFVPKDYWKPDHV